MTRRLPPLVIIGIILLTAYAVYAQAPDTVYVTVHDTVQDTVYVDSSVVVKVLEERIAQNEERSADRDGWLSDKMDIYLGLVTLFIAVVVFGLRYFGRRVIAEWTKKRVDLHVGVELRRELEDLREKANAAYADMQKMHVKAYEEVRALADEYKGMRTEKIPEEVAEKLADFEEKLARVKTNDEYTFEDWFNKGLAEGRRWDLHEAIHSFSMAIDADTDNSGLAHGNRGVAYSKLGNTRQALADLTKAIELAPQSAEPHFNRALVNQRADNLEQAVEDYSNAIESDSTYIPSYTGRARTNMWLGNVKEALADYSKAVEMAPEDAGSRCNLAEALFFAARPKEAVETADAVLTMSEDYSCRAVAHYLKWISQLVLGANTTDTSERLEQVFANDTELTWSFVDIDRWLPTADINDDKKLKIIKMTERLKEKQKKGDSDDDSAAAPGKK